MNMLPLIHVGLNLPYPSLGVLVTPIAETEHTYDGRPHVYLVCLPLGLRADSFPLTARNDNVDTLH